MEQKTPDRCGFEIRQPTDGEITIFLHGDLVLDSAYACLKDIRAALGNHSFENAVIDLGSVEHLDDYGAMVISEIRRMTGIARDRVTIINMDTHHKKVFELTGFDTDALYRATAPPPVHPVAEIGGAAIKAYHNILFFIKFIGSVTLSIGHVIRNPRSLRYNEIVLHMKTTGVDAIPVIGLISLMLGLIIAFISAMQLRMYGASIYVADLVALAMVSELGPIMTGILVAGRSGSAYAAEISTMEISEENDALFVMGIDPTRFLVIPRLIAAFLVVPILTMFSNIFAIVGGMFIGLIMLDIPMSAYMHQTMEALTLFEVCWGLSKSTVFAVLIAITGCLRGFQAKGGASSVGNAATSAVVTSIFMIIFFDSMFAIIRIYWG